MYAKISLTHHQTHEHKLVLYRHTYEDNPTEILAAYERAHPQYKRAETYVPYADVWHYVLEQNFTCISRETLIREWTNYRETSRPYTAVYNMATTIYYALIKETSLVDILKQVKPFYVLLTDHETKTFYEIETRRVLEYFLSECEQLQLQ